MKAHWSTKMSAEESNVSINHVDKGLDRLEVSRFRGFRSVQVPAVGIPYSKSPTEALKSPSRKAVNKAALAKTACDAETAKANPTATVATSFKDPVSETHDSDLPTPENPKREESKTLKRKYDEDDDLLIRNLYGYGDMSTSSAERHRGINKDQPVSAKRFRPMRRNSFLIHPRHGRGGPFPGISNAIEAALRETQRQQAKSATLEFCETLLREEPSTIQSKQYRFVDSTNASVFEKKDIEEASDARASK